MDELLPKLKEFGQQLSEYSNLKLADSQVFLLEKGRLLKDYCHQLIEYSNIKIAVSHTYILDKVHLLKTKISVYDTSTQVAAVTICVVTGVLGFTFVRLASRRIRDEREEPSGPTMKGLGIYSFDGFKAVTLLTNLEIPQVRRPDDVLIRVIASSIDSMDWKISCGYNKKFRRYITQYRQNSRVEFPIVLGRDCVGIVLETGEDATEFAIGDEVWAISPPSHQGYMSQVIVVPKSFVDFKPMNLAFEEAAALPYSAVIALSALSKGSVDSTSAKGKRVLVHDGSSAVGSLAIQLVKLWGGHITTTITKAAIPIAINLGVNDMVVHDIDYFTVELKKRKRFDVVLNTIGLILHDWCKEIAADRGIVISLVSGKSAIEKYGVFLGAIYSILSYIRNIFNERIILGNDAWLSNMELTAEPLEHVRHLIEVQKIRPITDSVWPLEDYKAAFKRSRHPDCVGKVIVRLD